MDNTMFMAFATEFDEYQSRVEECAASIKKGAALETALDIYEVEYEDVIEILKNF